MERLLEEGERSSLQGLLVRCIVPVSGEDDDRNS